MIVGFSIEILDFHIEKNQAFQTLREFAGTTAMFQFRKIEAY